MKYKKPSLKEKCSIAAQADYANALNAVLKDGKLFSRNGIKPVTASPIFSGNDELSAVYLTDCYLSDNALQRLSVFVSTDEDSYIDHTFMFIDQNGTAKNVGKISFNRTSQTRFSVPTLLSVINASPKKGSGIFALFSVFSDEGRELRFYELNSDMTKWIRYMTDEMYIPDYYINGRGTEYSAELKFAEPKFKEQINLLNYRYNCYFAADGFSHIFLLPIEAKTDGYSLKITYTQKDGATASWFISEKNTESESAVINNISVKATIERQSGTLCFKDGNQEPFIPSVNYSDINCIKVTVIPQNGGMDEIVKNAEFGICTDSDGFGRRLVLSGNADYPSTVCIGQTDNIFYIPKDGAVNVGNVTKRVTAFGTSNKKLTVFKDCEIYSVSNSRQELSVAMVSGKFGCDFPKSMVKSGDGYIWTNRDGFVYTLSGDTFFCAETQKKIPEPTKITGAVFSSGKYIVFSKNKLISVGVSDGVYNSLTEIPENCDVLAAMDFGGNTGFFIKTRFSKNGYAVCLSNFDGDVGKDVFLGPDGEKQEEASREFLPFLIKSNADPFSNKLFTKIKFRMYTDTDALLEIKNLSGDTLKTVCINMEYDKDRTMRTLEIFLAVFADGLELHFYGCGTDIGEIEAEYREA